ncbi:MAG: glycosyltransferase [Ktedonobacterales bacterium]|nr:glycosyltransferase [Ktedonobacterales bacterium]
MITERAMSTGKERQLPSSRSHTAPPLHADMTLCLIVRNEAHCLEDCLRSAQAACRRTIVADTGSTDDTAAIAARYGSEVMTCSMDGGYAAARNAVLDRVETEWVLFLDADEALPPADTRQLAATVSAAPADVLGYRLLRYNLFATGGWYSQRELKVFRHRPSIRYRRCVSETVLPTILEAGGHIANAPVLLNHFGPCEPVEMRAAKLEHYIALSQAQLRETPDDALLYGHIGLMLRSLGRLEEARAWSERGLRLDTQSATLHGIHGQVLRAMGRDEEARACYEAALRLRPGSAALWNLLGVMDLTRHALAAAESAFERAYALDPVGIHVEINLGLVAQAQGNYALAASRFARAAQRNPAFLHEVWAGRVECDPFRAGQYETIPQYAGLGYHLAYCRDAARLSPHPHDRPARTERAHGSDVAALR